MSCSSTRGAKANPAFKLTKPHEIIIMKEIGQLHDLPTWNQRQNYAGPGGFSWNFSSRKKEQATERRGTVDHKGHA